MTSRALSWLTLLLLLAAPLAIADDADGDESGHDEGEEKRRARSYEVETGERRLRVDVDGDNAVIKLSRESAGVEDAVKIELDTEDGLVQVKHESEEGENETEQKLQARFLAVVEFVDADGDEAYDADEPIASAYALGDGKHDVKVNGSVDWGPVSVTDALAGNATGKTLSSRAAIPGGGVFGLDFHVFGAMAVVGNASLLPTEAKVDVLIERYPYVRDDSRLAVLVDVKASREFSSESDDGEEALSATATTGNLTYALTFTWLETATVDGVDRPVASTVLRSKEESSPGEVEEKARVAWSYPRGAVIVHDPTVGVDYAAQGDDAHTHATPFPALPLVLAALVGLAAARRRVR